LRGCFGGWTGSSCKQRTGQWKAHLLHALPHPHRRFGCPARIFAGVAHPLPGFRRYGTRQCSHWPIGRVPRISFQAVGLCRRVCDLRRCWCKVSLCPQPGLPYDALQPEHGSMPLPSGIGIISPKCLQGIGNYPQNILIPLDRCPSLRFDTPLT